MGYHLALKPRLPQAAHAESLANGRWLDFVDVMLAAELDGKAVTCRDYLIRN